MFPEQCFRCGERSTNLLTTALIGQPDTGMTYTLCRGCTKPISDHLLSGPRVERLREGCRDALANLSQKPRRSAPAKEGDVDA